MIPLTLAPARAAGAAVLILVLGFAGGWLVNGWRLGADLAELRAEHAEQIATQATATVTTMQADAAAIHTAAGQVVAIQNTLGSKMDALRKEIKNAKALPDGCAPTDDRVRHLDAAIDAANAAAAGR